MFILDGPTRIHLLVNSQFLALLPLIKQGRIEYICNEQYFSLNSTIYKILKIWVYLSSFLSGTHLLVFCRKHIGVISMLYLSIISTFSVSFKGVFTINKTSLKTVKTYTYRREENCICKDFWFALYNLSTS